jgi:hypothetical protein
MNVKPRVESILHGLAPAQRVKLEVWLFQENLGLKQVVERCKTEFGIEVGISSVARYRKREQARCDLERKVRAQIEEEQAAGQGLTATMQFEALLRKMIQIAMKTAQVSTTPAELKVVSDYARVLIGSRREGHEGLRAATTREKFEFDAATACLIHQVKIQSIAADDALDDGERIQKIREELSGPDLPE